MIRIGFAEIDETVHTIFNSVAGHESAAVDHAVAGDEDIGEVFAPNQAVVKISVAAVLKRRAGKIFLRVVSLHFLRRAEDDRSGIDVQVDVVGETDAAAQISSGGNPDRAAARIRRRIDRLIDGDLSRVMPSPVAP